MSGVYIVNVFGIFDRKFSCDVFAGFEAASQRAIEYAEFLLGKESDILNKKPDEEKNDFGSKWFFVREYDVFVVVSFEKVNSSQPTSQNDVGMSTYIYDGYQAFNRSSSPPSVPLVPTIKKTIEDMGLNIPAGFSISNKPLTNADLIKYPYQFKSATKELTDAQKWALVTAIVKKSPDYYIILENTRFNQQFSLIELSNKSKIGLNIRDWECSQLDTLRDKMATELYGSLEDEENEF